MLTEDQLRALPLMTELDYRFWAKVEIIDDDDSCWPWRRCRHPEEGRGMMSWLHPETGKKQTIAAPRVAFYLTHGYLPVCACHTCDNPWCCRPKHIWDGSHGENNTDRASKGRNATPRYQRGSKNSYTTLTEEKVLAIREAAARGVTDTVLGDTFGVNRATITYIVRGKTWTHVGGPVQDAPNRNRRLGNGRPPAR